MATPTANIATIGQQEEQSTLSPKQCLSQPGGKGVQPTPLWLEL